MNRSPIVPRLIALSIVATSVARAQCPDGSPPPCDTRRPAPLSAVPKRVNPPLSDNTWIVLPFNNVTRAPDTDWLSDASVNLLTMDLSQWQDVHAIDDRRVADFMREIPKSTKLSFSDGVAVAKRAGAGRLVIGDILKVGSKTTVTATAYNVRDGKPIRSAREETTIADSLMPMFAKVARKLLAVPNDANVGSVGTTRVDAYQRYVAGVSALNRFDAQAAKAQFDAALRLDTNFALAHYKWAIASMYDVQAGAARMSQVKLTDVGNVLKLVEDTARIRHSKAAARLSGDLPPREKKLAAGLAAMAEHDLARACDAYGALVRADSSDVEALFGYGMCLISDDRIIAIDGDTTKVQFRSSWNTALKQFKRALAVDPTFHLAFDPIVSVLTAPVRPGCRSGDLLLTCADTNRQDRYVARVLPSGDSLVTTPLSLGAAAGPIDQLLQSQRLSPVRQNVEAARAAAADWAAAAPGEGLAHKHLSRLLLRLGRPAEAEAQVTEAMLDPALKGDQELFFDRLDIAIKLQRGKAVNALLDSIRAVMPGDLGSAAFASLAPITGRVRALDSLYRSLLKGDTSARAAMLIQLPRIAMGVATDTVLTLERGIYSGRKAGAECDAGCVAGLMGAPYELDLRRPRTWPKFLPGVLESDRRMGPALALAANDTTALRAAAQRLDSVSKAWAKSGNAENGTSLVAADVFLILRDSAAALSAVRRMMDTTLLASESTGLIGIANVSRGLLWPRVILLRADLEAAAKDGDRALAKDLYQRFLDLWSNADPEFATVIARVRTSMAKLGS